MPSAATGTAITVVVLAGGRLEKLLRCLESLRGGTLLPHAVILVDNAGDGEVRRTLDGVEVEFPIRILDGVEGGFAEARNHGLSHVETPLAAFIDDDCVADRHWLERIATALEEAEAVGGPTLPWQAADPPRGYAENLNGFAGLSTRGFWGDGAGRVELPQTANMGLRTEAWRAIPFPRVAGTFAPGSEGVENTRVGREDAEWWRAMRRAGRTCAVEARAIVWHDVPPSRFEWENITARAELDGENRWVRSRACCDLGAAASDVAQWPLRAARDLFDPEWTVPQALGRHGPWARRQAALMRAAVDDHEQCDFQPTARARGIATEFAKGLWGLAKVPAREAATLAHHHFKRVGPLPSRGNPPRRLLVVCHDFLGDAILCEPMLGALRSTYPGAVIGVLCGAVSAPVFGALEPVDETIQPERGGPGGWVRLARQLREWEPDGIVLAYAHGLVGTPLFAATRAPVAAWDGDNGLERAIWGGLAAAAVPKPTHKSEVAALMDLAGAFGADAPMRRPRFEAPGAACERVADVLDRVGLAGAPFAVVHVDGEEGGWKTWPPDRWGAVVRSLADDHGLRAVCVGSREGRRHVEMMDPCVEGTVSLHGRLDASELAALVARARIFAGPDSGPAHLAQAVRTPAVILFGPTEEHRWGPMPRLATDGDGDLPPWYTVRAAGAPADWHPAETGGFAADEHMRRIEPAQVTEAIGKVLEAVPAPA